MDVCAYVCGPLHSYYCSEVVLVGPNPGAVPTLQFLHGLLEEIWRSQAAYQMGCVQFEFDPVLVQACVYDTVLGLICSLTVILSVM